MAVLEQRAFVCMTYQMENGKPVWHSAPAGRRLAWRRNCLQWGYIGAGGKTCPTIRITALV